MNIFDARTLSLIGTVLALLGTCSIIVKVLKRRSESGIDPAILDTFDSRVRAWWILFATLAAAFLLGKWVTVIFFGLIGFWALREFITLTPTRPGDHRTLFWVFFLITPLQFLLVGLGHWCYPYYSILIPVYAFLFVPTRIALAGDYKRFLERTAKIQAGLLICVYCLSYAPALLTVFEPRSREAEATAASAGEKPGQHQNSASTVPAKAAEEADRAAAPWLHDSGSGVRLLFFFLLIVQLSDALQYAWAQIPSRHVIAPAINPMRTWEGLLGGMGSVMLVGAVLWWATPFNGAVAALMAGLIALMGFAGGITMSAIKRDRGVKDYGTLVEGHGGVLDRIDSICFAAPVFFHCTRWWLG